MLRLLWAAALVTGLSADTFETYVQRLKQDPSIQALYAQEQSQKAASDAAQALPDPQLILAVDNVPIGTPAFDRYLPTSKTLGIKQAFPNGRDHQATVGQHQAAASQLQAQYRHAQLITDFIEALSQRHASHQATHYVQEQKLLLEQIQKDLLARLESAQIGYAQLSRMDERFIALNEQLSRLKTRENVAEHTLLRLFNTIPPLEPPSLSPAPYTLEQLYPIQIAKRQARGATAQQQAAHALNAPDIALQFLYKQREAGETFDGEDWFSLGVTIGLPFWGKGEAAHRSALHVTSQRQATVALQKRQWQQVLQNLQRRYVEIQERLALHHAHLTIADERLEALNRAYESGTISLGQVLESRISKLNIHILIAELESQATIYAAQHNAHIQE